MISANFASVSNNHHEKIFSNSLAVTFGECMLLSKQCVDVMGTEFDRPDYGRGSRRERGSRERRF